MTLRLTAAFVLSPVVLLVAAGSLQAQTKLDRAIVQPGPGSLTSGYEKVSTCAYSHTVAGTGQILSGAGTAEGQLTTGNVTATNSQGETVVYENAKYITEGTLKRICRPSTIGEVASPVDKTSPEYRATMEQ